mgnify:CR=1 FL=1
MQKLESATVVQPQGFRMGSASAGLKKTEGELDTAVLLADEGTAGAGVFTTNRFAAAPVRWSREHLPADDLRGVAVNSGNANACTGPKGQEHARRMAELVAEKCGCSAEQVAVCSTGIIGHPLPIADVEAALGEACDGASDSRAAGQKGSEAILTTDRGPKTSGARAEVDGDTFTVCGMAKGAGMIAPELATMLCFITTDAQVSPAVLQDMLGQGVQNSFNAITVDGDMSTNDTVLALASGASGVDVEASKHTRKRFGRALRSVLQDLAIQVVRGAEGASKLLRVQVTGARTRECARSAARAVASSLLFKCAMHGEDPNWGRVVCALGYSGAWFEPDDVTISIGAATVFEEGRPTGAKASSELQGSEASIYIDLGAGQHKATMWTCDLSKDYVDINAGYAV